MSSFKDAKRVVIKVGTSTLTYETGNINLRSVEALVKVIADIKNSGREIILVSSGAIGVGMGKLRMKTRPSDIPSKQAAAAIGQCELMYLYDKLFSAYSQIVSQVLLTRDVVEDERRKQNVVNTFDKLLEFGAIPVVNENDTVAVEEIEATFGENDTLSAIVAVLTDADTLIILSDIDGLYDADPRENPDAKRIDCVYELDEIRGFAGGAGSARGSGGMATKIAAAEIVLQHGIEMAIISGGNPDDLYRLLDGEKVGTRFCRRALQEENDV